MAGIKICPVCGAPVTFHERRSGSEWTCWLEAQSPRWISVKERLPEMIHHYGELSYSDSVLVYDGSRVRVACYSTIGEWYDSRYEDDIIEVTHWAPLPELPEEDE